MISTDAFILSVVLTAYFAATCLFLLYLVRLNESLARCAFFINTAGFIGHTVYLIHTYFELQYFPVASLHQSLSFFAWALMGIFLLIHTIHQLPIIGSFVTPVATFFMIGSVAVISSHPLPLPPALQSFWLPIHTILAFIGEAVFGIAFCVGIMYLIQENLIKKKRLNTLFYRLPSLQTLDQLNYYCLSIGFPFLTLGIITGSLWAALAWGSYWSWDPKETWSLITWFIYAALLHGRLLTGWRGRRAAIFSIIGFSAVIFTFLGVNLLLPGLHSYENLMPQVP